MGHAHGAAFRLADDRNPADVHDEETAPAPDARVRIAHPLDLGADVGAWSELFADHEIVQPFPRLSRPVHALTDEERAATSLPRFVGATAPVGGCRGRSRGAGGARRRRTAGWSGASSARRPAGDQTLSALRLAPAGSDGFDSGAELTGPTS